MKKNRSKSLRSASTVKDPQLTVDEGAGSKQVKKVATPSQASQVKEVDKPAQAPASKKWLIYGDILEKHVVDSFCVALQDKNIEVLRVPSLTRSHTFVSDSEILQRVQENLEQVLSDHDIDVLFNFRVSELVESHFELLKRHGVFTFGWLHDDPLLYGTCYRHVVDFYDIVLHCGHEDVISFYQERHPGINGFGFPFWSSNEILPYSYRPDTSEFDIGFLGNCHTVNRSGRYELLASLPFKTVFYGLPPKEGDACNIHGGLIEDERDLPGRLSNLKMALSVPQFFRDARETSFYFDDLDRFESFYFPSRIVQYAACGIPTLIRNCKNANDIVPSLVTFDSRYDLIQRIRQFLSAPEALVEYSRSLHADFERFLTARSRVEMLLQLVEHRAGHSMGTRVNLWRDFPPQGVERRFEAASPATEKKEPLPDLNSQKKGYLATSLAAEHRFKVLFIGKYYYGSTDIVSRLKVALENVGHQVFELNCDLFPDAIHNPEKRSGGFGPIEVRLDKIMPVIRQFRPQFIVCCAGGYTFSEQDAQSLKEMGVVLVGMALSDPDVFPSEKTFAGRFDYHTTNALLSLDEYRNEGQQNTLYFPFAIDRSFIESDVAAEPRYAADVISIGHAKGRPERVAVMQELSSHFDVRTYGDGWPLPGSFIASDDTFFKVAKAGKFHINFPTTRASFVNVKIGIFESIACGGVVFTQHFDEMTKFFEYDKEVLGYRDLPDLIAKLRYFLRHPEEAEEIRRAAYARLIAEHTWEQRWNSLFQEIRLDLTDRKEILPRHRYEQISLQDQPEPCRIVVSGYYGAENTGDELILKSILNNFSARYSNAEFTVCTENIAKTTLTHGVQSVPRSDLYRMDSLLKRADLFILGGGGLFQDYFFQKYGGVADFFDSNTHALANYGALPTMARIHDVPVIFFALGIGPLNNPDAKKMMKFLCNQADVVTVRDAYSKSLLESIPGFHQKVMAKADPTVLLDLPSVAPGSTLGEQQGVIGDHAVAVCLRNWFDFPASLKESFAQICDWIVEEFGYKILFVPFQYRATSHDNSVHRDVHAMMKHPECGSFYENTGDDAELLSTLSHVKITLAMRLHGSILSNLMGTPSIGFSYDPKIQAYYEEVGLPECCLPLDFDAEEVKKLFSFMVNNYGSFQDKIACGLRTSRERSKETFELAFTLVSSDRGRQKTAATSKSNRIPVRDQLKKLQDDYAQLQEKFDLLNRQFEQRWMELPFPGLSFAAGDGAGLSGTWTYPENDVRLNVSPCGPNGITVECRMSGEDKFYLVSSSTPFSVPPPDGEQWSMEPNRKYQVKTSADFLSGSAQAELWVIEYDSHQRLAHSNLVLRQGDNSLKFTASPGTSCFKVALRFDGEGTLTVAPIRIYGLSG